MACSGAPLPGDFSLAQTRERAGDEAGALELYRKAADDCRRTIVSRPHDDCALAIMREAQTLERMKRFRDAYRAWLELPAVTRDAERAARAYTRAAQLATDELADDTAAARWAWAVCERFPETVPADVALGVAVRLGKRHDPAALAARLRELYPRVEQTDLGDNVLYESAELYRAAGEGAAAIALYDQLAEKYPRSGLRDDSWWRAAELARAAGDARGAVRRLQRLLETRRDAIITGSYNSILLDDAQLLIGRILLEDLHDAGEAVAAFHTLAFDFPESILRDDALVELARAQLARHAPPSPDDRRDACASLARLLKKYPNSNKRRAAESMRVELACNP
jgi:tetratricopeptide (TPR) repeat protein